MNLAHKKGARIFFQSISKIKAQNLTVETQNSCMLDTSCAQTYKMNLVHKNGANFFPKVRHCFRMN